MTTALDFIGIHTSRELASWAAGLVVQVVFVVAFWRTLTHETQD
jgi:hypothetical protein